jgi:hypothetical protein
MRTWTTRWAGALALLSWVSSSLAHPTDARGEHVVGCAVESVARIETVIVWPTLSNDVSTVDRDISETLTVTPTHGDYVSASDNNNTKDIECDRKPSTETIQSEKRLRCSRLENVSLFVVWK